MKLPKIYEYFKHGQLFTIEEARLKLGTTGNTLRKRLSELSSRGYIDPIRQGLYRLNKIKKKSDQHESSPYAIASKLTPQCYLGFKTALQLHANEVPAPSDIVYVVSPTKFNSFHFERRLYFWCQTQEHSGIEAHPFADKDFIDNILATNFEKTLVDCLKRPAHSPSLADFLSLTKKVAKKPDMEKLMGYAADCKVQTVFNRLGFLLEIHKEHWNICETVIKEAEKRMSRKQTEWPIFSGFSSSKMDPTQDGSLNPAILAALLRWKINFVWQNSQVPPPRSIFKHQLLDCFPTNL